MKYEKSFCVRFSTDNTSNVIDDDWFKLILLQILAVILMPCFPQISNEITKTNTKNYPSTSCYPRSVFRTLSNIYDGVFGKVSNT